MHLRVMECNSDAPKTFNKPKLKVEHRNNALPEGLWLGVLVWARFYPPVNYELIIHDDMDLINLARSYYDDLPDDVRHVEPFDGTFTVIKSGQTGVGVFPRRHVDLAMMRKIAYHRSEDEFFKNVAEVMRARIAFSAPWNTSSWTVVWGTHLAFQRGKKVPTWLMKYCAKEQIRLDMATTWPVTAYA